MENYIVLLILVFIALFCIYKAITYNKKQSNKSENGPVMETYVAPQQEVEPLISKQDERAFKSVNSILDELYPEKTYSYVTGTKHENRQSLIRKALREEIDYYEKYDGLKGTELKEELLYGKVWEYPPIEAALELVHEPENEYDENAIAVYADIDETMKIGYIPKEDNEYVLSIMEEASISVTGIVKGGKYKELDWDETIKTDTKPYYIDLIIRYDKK